MSVEGLRSSHVELPRTRSLKRQLEDEKQFWIILCLFWQFLSLFLEKSNWHYFPRSQSWSVIISYLQTVGWSSTFGVSRVSSSSSAKSCKAYALPNNEKLELASILLGNGTLPRNADRPGSTVGPGEFKLSSSRAWTVLPRLTGS